jgi:membrane protease YdiL (CAAX protease family)
VTRLGCHAWLVAVLAFLIQLIPTLVYYARTGGESEGSVLSDLWPGLVVAAVLLVGLVFATGWVRQVGLVRPTVGWWKWYVLPVAWAGGLAVVGRVSGWAEPEAFPVVALVVVVILIGFNEELVFRGFLLHSFRSRMPLIGAIIATSALFALMHTGTPGPDASTLSIVVTIGSVFALAVLQAALYIAGGSLLPVILFHAWWDLMIFSGGGIDLTSDSATLGWTALISTIAMALGYSTYLLQRATTQPPPTEATHQSPP